MSKEEIYSCYMDLGLTDKLILATAIMYDLDVGDYSAMGEDRAKDWSECFVKMVNHLETEIGKRLSDAELTQLERRAKAIKEAK